MPDLSGWAHVSVPGFRFGTGAARFGPERAELLKLLHAAGLAPQLVPPDWPGPRAVQEDGSAWPGRLHPAEVPEAVRGVLAEGLAAR